MLKQKLKIPRYKKASNLLVVFLLQLTKLWKILLQVQKRNLLNMKEKCYEKPQMASLKDIGSTYWDKNSTVIENRMMKNTKICIVSQEFMFRMNQKRYLNLKVKTLFFILLS
jgi:hypothetical protein